WLDNLICQLLEKKPEHRPYDAAMVAQSLGQVAEKVAALQSAGVDVARARRADRSTAGTATIDAADKKVARSLLAGVRVRAPRKKRARKSIFEKAWFQGLAIVIFLAGIGFILFTVFQPPSPDQLFQQIQRQLKAAQGLDARLEVRAG